LAPSAKKTATKWSPTQPARAPLHAAIACAKAKALAHAVSEGAKKEKKLLKLAEALFYNPISPNNNKTCGIHINVVYLYSSIEDCISINCITPLYNPLILHFSFLEKEGFACVLA